MFEKINCLFNPFLRNGEQASKKIRYIEVLFLSFLLLIIMTIAVSNKQLGHVDEFYSFALSNSGYMGRNHPEIFEKSLHWYAYDTVINSILNKTDEKAEETLLNLLTNAGYINKNQDKMFKNDFEYFAYNLMLRNYEKAADFARHKIWDSPLVIFMFADGKTSFSNKDMKEIMMPNDNAKFNFGSVFWNQSFDVHPPLYYMLLNVICSCFHNNGDFSKWHALTINLLFFLLTLLLVYYIMYNISKGNHGFSLLTMTVYGIIGGGAVAFLRMYMMLTFFSLLYTALILPLFENENKTRCWLLGITIILGSLTHHYFLVYLGISGFLLILYLIFKHQKNFLLKFTLVSAISILISVIIFPFTVIHMFFSEHGAIDIFYKLSTMDGVNTYLSYISEYFNFINKAIFGAEGYIPFIIFILMVCYAYYKNKKSQKIFLVDKIGFFMLTVALYVVFVAITTKYQDERYIFNVYPVIVVCFMYFLNSIYSYIKLKSIFIIILIIIFADNLTQNVSKYLYPDALSRYNIIEAHKNMPCIFVYDEKNHSFSQKIGSLALINEFSMFPNVEFVKYQDLNATLANLKENSAVIYFCSDNNEKAVEYLIKNANCSYDLLTSEKGYPTYKINIK